jgi:hypothetical protein
MRALRICLAVVGSITAGIAVFTAAIAMMMAISAVVRSASVAVPQPGSQAADFVLQDLNGETVRLSEYRGLVPGLPCHRSGSQRNLRPRHARAGDQLDGTEDPCRGGRRKTWYAVPYIV